MLTTAWNCTAPLSRLPFIQGYTFKVAFGVAGASGTLLNATVIFLLFKEKIWNTFANVVSMSLLISGLLTSAVSSPLFALLLSNPKKKHGLCIMSNIAYLFVTLMVTSGLTVGVIAYDRYQFIARDSTYRNFMTTSRKVLLVAFPWFAPLVILLGKLLNEETLTWVIFGCYLLCYTMLIESYRRLIRFLKRRLEQLNRSGLNDRGSRTRYLIHKQNRTATRLILIVITLFMACSLGTLTYRVLLTVDLYRKGGLQFFKAHGSLIHAVGLATFQLNICLNPIVYFSKHKVVRAALKRLLVTGASRRPKSADCKENPARKTPGRRM